MCYFCRTRCGGYRSKVRGHSPHSMVHPLAKQLNGRLSSVFLPRWHVHVIHKDGALLSHGRTEHTFPPLVQLRHDQVLQVCVCVRGEVIHMCASQQIPDLCLSSPCLCREVDQEWNELLLVQSIHEVILHVHTLACSCGPNKQDCPAVLDHEVHQKGVPKERRRKKRRKREKKRRRKTRTRRKRERRRKH